MAIIIIMVIVSAALHSNKQHKSSFPGSYGLLRLVFVLTVQCFEIEIVLGIVGGHEVTQGYICGGMFLNRNHQYFQTLKLAMCRHYF